MLSEISNIIIEDEFIIIVTLDGDKHTIAIDNDNQTHKAFIDNIISFAESIGVLQLENPEQGNYGKNIYSDITQLIYNLEKRLIESVQRQMPLEKNLSIYN